MGAINVKHTGSGAAIALSSDGTSLLLDGTAIGGGGGDPDLYRDNPVSAVTPTATGNNAVALGSGAVASGDLSFAFGSSGSNAAISSGSQSISMGSYSRAYGGTSIGIGYSAEASSAASGGVALGQNARSGGSYAVGLANSRASGSNSFAAAIANNSATYGASGANSIAMGQQVKATASSSLAIGGSNNTASGSHSAVIGGTANSASGWGAITLGNSCTADGDYSSARGTAGHTNGIYKKHAIGLISTMQGAYFVLGHNTTDATPIALNTSVWTPSSTNQIVLPNNSAYSFSGTIIARESAAAGSDYASWEIKGALLRDANAASTVLGSGIQNKLYATSGASAWTIALTADTTNGGLKIEVTGAAATNIRWVATVNTSEVTYA